MIDSFCHLKMSVNMTRITICLFSLSETCHMLKWYWAEISIHKQTASQQKAWIRFILQVAIMRRNAHRSPQQTFICEVQQTTGNDIWAYNQIHSSPTTLAIQNCIAFAFLAFIKKFGYLHWNSNVYRWGKERATDLNWTALKFRHSSVFLLKHQDRKSINNMFMYIHFSS